MATVNKIAVYSYDDTGKLTFVRAVDADWSNKNETATSRRRRRRFV